MTNTMIQTYSEVANAMIQTNITHETCDAIIQTDTVDTSSTTIGMKKTIGYI